MSQHTQRIYYNSYVKQTSGRKQSLLQRRFTLGDETETINNYTLNDFLFLSNSVIPPANSYSNINNAIADTGCTGHYAGTSQNNKQLIHKPITVLLPNGGKMVSSHVRNLHIPSLPAEACTQYLFPDMKTSGLLSIGQL